MKTVVTAGEILVEIMATRIGQTFLEPGPLVGPFPSGAPAIFVDQCGRLGQPCGLIAAVGDDDFGTLNLDRLRASGVDVSAVAVHPGVPTGSAFVRYHEDGGRSFVFNIAHSASARIALDGAARALLDRADHLHVMGTALFSPAVIDVALGCVGAVKARSGTVSFDPNLRPELAASPACGTRSTPSWRVATFSCRAETSCSCSPPARTRPAPWPSSSPAGIPEIVWKRGAEGAIHHDARGRTAVPGFPVEEVDPTGAGDCFGAGFVSMRLRGEPPERALRVACACGALAVTKQGPHGGHAHLGRGRAVPAGARRVTKGATVAVLDVGKTNVKLSAVTPGGHVAETLSVENRSLPGPPLAAPRSSRPELLDLKQARSPRPPAPAGAADRHRPRLGRDAGGRGPRCGRRWPRAAHGGLRAALAFEPRCGLPAPRWDFRGPAARRLCRAPRTRRASFSGRSATCPAEFAAARWHLGIPQYWAWRLTGRAVSEASFLGAQSHLWNVPARRWAPIVDARGWSGSSRPSPPPGRTWGRSAPTSPAATDLPNGLRVHAGAHDSTTNAYRYEAAGALRPPRCLDRHLDRRPRPRRARPSGLTRARA
jgi:sugar/nucleoside kinase (ribokinase family)